MKFEIIPYNLNFKRASGTSRGILTSKRSLFIKLNKSGQTKYGELSFIPGLNHKTEFETIMKLNEILPELLLKKDLPSYQIPEFPEIQFALDMLNFPQLKNNFTTGVEGIPINGLIWMGNIEFMQMQIEEKLQQGYKIIKLKIGAIHWQEEHELLKMLRNSFSADQLEIRVDANGAFDEETAKTVLNQLGILKIHSIEQPIKKGNWRALERLCKNTPVPIALDEELIGITKTSEKKELLKAVKPQYLILKPGLMGGFSSCDEWIKIASAHNIGYWVTSALESNIGLNAIAQWTFTLNNPMPQGLGTGGLYTNNIASPLHISGSKLFYNPTQTWDYSFIDNAPRLQF